MFQKPEWVSEREAYQHNHYLTLEHIFPLNAAPYSSSFTCSFSSWMFDWNFENFGRKQSQKPLYKFVVCFLLLLSAKRIFVYIKLNW